MVSAPVVRRAAGAMAETHVRDWFGSGWSRIFQVAQQGWPGPQPGPQVPVPGRGGRLQRRGSAVAEVWLVFGGVARLGRRGSVGLGATDGRGLVAGAGGTSFTPVRNLALALMPFTSAIQHIQ